VLCLILPAGEFFVALAVVASGGLASPACPALDWDLALFPPEVHFGGLTPRTKQEHMAARKRQEKAVSRFDREKWRQEISAKFPHHVDVVPPSYGYSRREEEDIMTFLESRISKFDLFGALTPDGTPFIRYCFERAADADAFRARFDLTRETSTLRKAG
jgi:hypothetical protein